MKSEAKGRQIVVRFSDPSYNAIKEFAAVEHRGLGDFVRHATLHYIEHTHKKNDSPGTSNDS